MTVDPTSTDESSETPISAGPQESFLARVGRQFYDVRNPTMMVKKPGILLRLLGALFFRRVTFDDEEVEKIRDRQREGVVIYVMPSQSLLDYLYFNWAFLRKGLPLAVFGTGMRMWPFRTLAAMTASLIRRIFGRRKSKTERDIVHNAPMQGRAIVLFLRKARTLLPWWGEFEQDPLRDVLQAQQAMDRPIFLVPVLLVWERAPGSFRRGIMDRVFGDPDAPGRMRKIVNFLGNYKRSLVTVGEPVNVREFTAENEHLGRLDKIGQKIRWALNQDFRLVRKVVKGPVLRRATDIVDEIMRQEPFRARLSELAVTEERSVDVIQEEARGYLKEIATDFKLSYIEALCIVLTWIFSRIYAGIETTGLSDVREAAKRAPLVILPSHKSHLDYLLISYIFYAHGLVPPHIAAGDNLNFWPLGHIFRRGGAFFLRRSFKQNPVYADSFKTYVHKLAKTGYSMEFFVEGGRSRTGKVLSPRFGLLGHVVSAVVEGHVHDLSIVPAAIGYEKIVEAEGYARELSGASKERENLGQLVGAASVLTERFGRVYLNFPKPFSLRDFLEAMGVDLEAGFEDDAHRRLIIKRLGYEILGGINRATVATPSSVVALALLGNPRRGISRESLLRRVGAVIDYIMHCDGPMASALTTALAANRVALERTRGTSTSSLSAALAAFDGETDLALEIGETLSDVVDETVSLFAEKKHMTINEYEDGAGVVYQVPGDKRIELDYYKNNIVHHFATESILACTLLRCWREDDLWGDRLRNETDFLSRMLKTEYVFEPSVSFDVQYVDTLKAFEEAGLLQADRAAKVVLSHQGMRTLRLLANLTLPVVEGYYVAARGLLTLDEPIVAKDHYKRLQSLGDRLWRQGELTSKEAVSSVVFANAVMRFKDDKLVTLETRPVGRNKTARYVIPGPALQDVQAVEDLVDRLKRFLIPFF